jgi:hypothetical protein
MGTDPGTAVERAMEIQEVLMRVLSGQVSWVQAAAIIGLSDRQVRRGHPGPPVPRVRGGTALAGSGQSRRA